MDYIEWSDQFSVGFAELDRQHQRIVKLINRLIEIQSSPEDSEEISDTLTRMREYAEDHFSFEENQMAKCEYPKLEEQIQMHKTYKIQFTHYCNAVLNGEEKVGEQVLEFLVHWWKQHVLEEDMKYKDSLPSAMP